MSDLFTERNSEDEILNLAELDSDMVISNLLEDIKCLNEDIQKIQAENAELKKQSQWISVDDELPPLLQTVEVWLVGEQCYERAWRSKWSDGEITWIFSNQAYEDCTLEITHWKNLSTPPEGE